VPRDRAVAAVLLSVRSCSTTQQVEPQKRQVIPITTH
jgi:hypothetical protein